MWSKLESIFLELGLDYARQGSYAEDDVIPQSLFTFWNVSTPYNGFFDNKANKKIWVWQIYFYTKDANIIYSKLDDFISLAKREGFIVEGNGNDIPSDVPNYFGRMVRINYIENL